MDYEVVIGLEIHVELDTESKMFCGCSTKFFSEEPNIFTCPVCLGMPGSLPVPNEKAIEYTVKIGLALNSKIASFTKFDRKNYFYPDMPKDYQISQYDLPICEGGSMDVEVNGFTRKISITRVHLEEDTGKLIHIGESGRIGGADYSLVDFNRAGVPLVEIVTEPDIRTPDEAKAFAQKLKNIIEHLGVSDCDMEKGSFRCDANISLRPKGAKEHGTKSEVKNMNSFRAIQKALIYEIERQRELLETGERVVQETRHWDAANNITMSLRSKEEAHDYRYFPEPDLVSMELSREWIEDLKKTLPELPDARKKRFMEIYKLSVYDVEFLTSSKAMGDYFEECTKSYSDAKKISNLMMGELSMHLNAANLKIEESAVTPKHLVQLLKLIDDGQISGKMAKDVFKEVFETGKLPKIIVEEKGLFQISDEGEIVRIVDMVLEENQKAVEEYKSGKGRTLGFLVGQVMKLTKGSANPQLVNKILKKKLS
ncbi:Asp-tRNA(Asn)/Glu-tRNA(Gln) amidotransferase subunit GatB [Candidatus Oleimmundimicrobium sp.]|uniref:Asp-tRNA(Asn)/Glu-tRNA(Gln) amidotransferase subunit GatB n=1 Tax=Candidatus Oleimmundimicrobium sp. TaxID=3060597 RepID=UPI00271F0809|nr:Asp-tRNA(Asn)/Glu-tRNA(Gln) amidotransferase subunit GatB [Candidatus Oleimmundimicrobium sp.]MDO8886585.1 Asp-tRNA(Asn)/Glu-tRNA(Gln) amidotransferase subunit GatB [Candidatus Oleimmundimicrobium sp.]